MSSLREIAIEAAAAYRSGMGSAEQCREAAEAAVRGDANLSDANLWGANLSSADLRNANLGNANLRDADLGNANLRGADLRGADLYGANLRNANLWGANLGGADLRGADLWDADLYGANLRNANLRGAKINWLSHDLVAELLRQAAGADIGKRKVAGLVLVSRDWCWRRFLALDDPQRDWALNVLREYVTPDDEAPDILQSKGGA